MDDSVVKENCRMKHQNREEWIPSKRKKLLQPQNNDIAGMREVREKHISINLMKENHYFSKIYLYI